MPTILEKKKEVILLVKKLHLSFFLLASNLLAVRAEKKKGQEVTRVHEEFRAPNSCSNV